jgi:hypothetical protein
MNDQYLKFVIENRLARKRLAQTFDSRDSEMKRRFSPVADRIFATDVQKNTDKDETSTRHRVRSKTGFFYRTRSGVLAKQSSTTKRDSSGFCFMLFLLFLSEITASQTENPVFWLLVGPTPLAIAFAAYCYLRYKSARSGSEKTIRRK